ncbi:hypothetical protein HPB48_022995 [Haemaphysalis longicornis]|uniref:Uncharacterized protein n=1 Tax=Haemaphysalis longicornis TaxID=44386 RepID=A0A9J6H0P3_HAELO|nr:hypothetical protein HPB48_022995 [Haemaphysalis longicornis]
MQEGSTHATFYGGPRLLLRRAAGQAFDEGGLTIDPTARSTTRGRRLRGSATAANRSSLALPEIPAIQVAHAAFLQALANESQPAKRLMEGYTEEQVFFIVACFTLCQVERNAEGSYGGDCNRAVKNFAPFAEAFACRDGSSMKPTNRCLYFD